MKAKHKTYCKFAVVVAVTEIPVFTTSALVSVIAPVRPLSDVTAFDVVEHVGQDTTPVGETTMGTAPVITGPALALILTYAAPAMEA